MKKILVVADDFGMSSKINQGIITAHKNGVVSAVTIIPTGEAFEEAINLLKENKELSVGIHIDIDKFFNIDHSIGLSTGPKIIPLPIEEIENEVKKQIDTIKSRGIEIQYLTSHHHVHLEPELIHSVIKTIKEYNILKMRFFRKYYKDQKTYERIKNLIIENGIYFPPHFIEGWYWGNVDEPYEIAELSTHPGYGEVWREYELSVCCNPDLKRYLNEKGISLIGFKDL